MLQGIKNIKGQKENILLKIVNLWNNLLCNKVIEA